MKYMAAIVAAFFAVVVAASLAPHVRVLGVAPDLVLIFAACWAMVRGQREAMIVVLAVLRDVRPVDSDFLPTLVVVAAASLAYAVISMTVLSAVGDDVPWGTGLLRVAFPSMLVNALFTVVVYVPMRSLSPRPRTESFGVGSAVQL